MTGDRPQRSLSERVSAGAAMLVGGALGVRLISFGSLAILGRLLGPEDYAVMALALVVIGFLQLVSDLQFSNALVRLPALDDSHFDTVFVLALIRGGVLTVALFFSADAIAVAMNTPSLAEALRWAALIPLGDALRNPRFVVHARRVDFRAEVATMTVARVGANLASIALAILIGDYRALIAGAIVSTFLWSAMTYALAPRKLGVSLAHWRAFLGFGGWMTGAGLLGFADQKLDTALIGATAPTPTLGQFAMGEQIATMATQQISQPLGKALLPGLAVVAQEPDRLRAAYRRAQSTLLGVMLPIGVGLAVVAPDLIRVLVGPQWAPAAPILQMLAPALAFATLSSGVQALAMATGDTRALFNRGLQIMALRTPAALIGIAAAGVPGVVAARALSSVAGALLTLRLGATLTRDSALAPVWGAWRSLVACAAMAAAALAAAALADGAPIAARADDGDVFLAALRLAAAAAAGAIVYPAVCLALWAATGRPPGFESVVLSGARRVAWRVTPRLARRLSDDRPSRE